MRPSCRTFAPAIAFLLLAAACADDTAAPSVDAEPGTDAAPTYDCFGVRATLDELEAAPSVADLDDHPGVPMFAEHADNLEAWRAVHVEVEEIGAISELDPPDELDGEIRDHQRLVVSKLDDPMPPETDEEGWMVSSSGPCALRADLGDLEPANVHLDGTPDSDSAAIDLLAVEQACATGSDAHGRVRIDVDETADEVRLVVGVEPLGGDQACPSNPGTPVTVDLDEPLGDRAITDAGRYPPIEVTPAPDDLPVAR